MAVSIDNTAPTVPGIPTGASPVSALPTFSFTTSTDIGGSGINRYDVYRTGTVPPIGTATPAGGGLFAFSDSGAVAGTNTYSVVAVDNAGNSSAHSADVTIFLDPNGQSAPTGLTPLATPTNQRPQFSWVAPASFAVDHYRVTRVGGPTTDNIPSTTTTFTETRRPGDNTYTYQVVAVDSEWQRRSHLGAGDRSSTTRRRPPRRAASLPAPRSTAPSASMGRPRATAPARA